jgi:hypothetical protein
MGGVHDAVVSALRIIHEKGISLFGQVVLYSDLVKGIAHGDDEELRTTKGEETRLLRYSS